MRTTILLLLTLSILLLPDFSSAQNIGVSLPLTGPAAQWGLDIQKMLNFLNSRDGKPKYNFIWEDDRCDPKEAASIAQKFVAVHQVRLVLGLPCSGTVLSSASIYERNKIVLIAIGPGAKSISQVGDYIFRTRPSDEGSAALLAKYVASKHHKKIGMLVEQTEYPQQFAATFLENLGERSEAVERTDFLSGEEFPTLLLKLKAKGIDALVALPQTEKGLIAIVKTMGEQRFSIPLYGSNFGGSPTFRITMGKAADGIEYAGLPSRSAMLTPAGTALLDAYEKQNGPLLTLDYTFPITELAYVAADSAFAAKAEDIKAYLYKARLHGSIGEFSFDKNGDLVGMNYAIERIVDSKPVVVYR